jgi:hypothetical protein
VRLRVVTWNTPSRLRTTFQASGKAPGSESCPGSAGSGVPVQILRPRPAVHRTTDLLTQGEGPPVISCTRWANRKRATETARPPWFVLYMLAKRSRAICSAWSPWLFAARKCRYS